MRAVFGARSGREKGAAAVEFALVLPLLLLLVYGITDTGRAFESQLILSRAAQEGARLAAIGEQGITARVQAAAAGAGTAAVRVTGCPQPFAGTDAQVTVSVPFQVGAAALVGLPPVITLSASAVMPCEP